MENCRLKYVSTAIVLQEVPDEISLAINISGCPYKCKGCHSSFLWEYTGECLLDNLQELIDEYKPLISCVCLMGGDQNMSDLEKALRIIKDNGLKTCIYSGCDTKEKFNPIISLLDYLKYGSYKEELGGLKSPTTNQKMFNLRLGKEIIFYKSRNSNEK